MPTTGKRLFGILERMCIENAQPLPGAVVELAQLAADSERAISLLREWFGRDEEHDVYNPCLQTEWNACMFCGSHSTDGSARLRIDDHEKDCYYLKVRQFLDSLGDT